MRKIHLTTIITGRFETASEEEKAMIRQLLGENAEYNFEIYFHWYNVIHELGHAIMNFNCSKRPHPAEEEQLVNQFAAAYWRRYGEPQKLEALADIVHGSLERFRCPATYGQSPLSYAKEAWGTEELNTFNNYGWFQFSTVNQALTKPIPLDKALQNMGIKEIRIKNAVIQQYEVNVNLPYRVIEDAVRILKEQGVFLPGEIHIVLSDDPNCHRCEVKFPTVCGGI